MTVGFGKALVIRRIRRSGRSILVTVDAPQPFTKPDTDYFCRLRIEGLQPAPIIIQTTGTEPAQALMSGLTEVSARLSVSLPDFLSEARIGGDLAPAVG